MKYLGILILFIFYGWSSSTAQDFPKVFKLHSHNDYLQTVPFWEAYANQMESIEADVILMDNTLYVAHERESIKNDRTLISLYLEPIRKAFELGFNGSKNFQLLIDIKTEPYVTLKKLDEILLAYQDIIKTEKKFPHIDIVISGNRPTPQEFVNYPDYIKFDYQNITDTTNIPWEKIALISLNFRKLSLWNGKGKINSKDRDKILRAIQTAHTLEKPIRFWATPDTKKAWKTLHKLGVDFINTDQPFEARKYFE